MKEVLVPLEEGFEEIEALAVVDILRRADIAVTIAGGKEGVSPAEDESWEVVRAGCECPMFVEGRNGIRVVPDATIEEAAGMEFDMIVLPGGAKGTENLKRNSVLLEMIKSHYSKGRPLAAICAAPTVLKLLGITKGRTITSHPSVRGELKEEKVSDERVVVDGALITSQAPGTAVEFAFKLVEILSGAEKAKEVNRTVLSRL
jgi:4-methyl-5(b-hydroxyethyl)-thiazole monophosphate biosynthesis